jgi:hypothetical protein
MTFKEEFQTFIKLHASCDGEPDYRTARPTHHRSDALLTVTARCPGCLTERVFDLSSADVFDMLDRNVLNGSREKGGA